jgi:hypothetical protein
MLPNFLIIGAAKAGTTSLHQYLRHHPQVFMPETKELSYFVEENNWNRGRGWYRQQFEGATTAVAIGEASPRYAMYPVYRGVPRRIAELLPGARLIYVVRDPIERMRSHYLDRLIYGVETEPIEQALLTNPIYLNSSRYALQIEQYLEYFSREKLLIVRAEYLRHDRARIVRRILEFLGIEGDWHAPVLEREFHTTAERRMPRLLGRRILRSRARGIFGRLPPLVRERLLGPFMFRRVATDRIAIPEGIRCQLADALRDDVRRLHRYVEDSFDGWGIC